CTTSCCSSIFTSGLEAGSCVLWDLFWKRDAVLTLERYRAGQDGDDGGRRECEFDLFDASFLLVLGGADESGRGQKGLVVVYSAQKATQSHQEVRVGRAEAVGRVESVE
ncbi:hypothetical protein C8F01DRAFT_1239688, partial [Mycena amicta]